MVPTSFCLKQSNEDGLFDMTRGSGTIRNQAKADLLDVVPSLLHETPKQAMIVASMLSTIEHT